MVGWAYAVRRYALVRDMVDIVNVAENWKARGWMKWPRDLDYRRVAKQASPHRDAIRS